MSDLKLTDAQRDAVTLRGAPILVSAAAGSGKTRVLTERLMARVAEGEDISRFLVITFTRAAAAELRGRILEELNARLAADPLDPWLRRQSSELYRAQIGTIDSFCGAVVREHAHLLGISPGFSMMDEERSRTLRARALEDVLDKAYETIGENEGLRALADSVGAGRDDRRLAEIVLSLYDQMQSRAFPEKWLSEKVAALAAEGIDDAGDTIWGAYILGEARREADYHAGALNDAVSEMAASGQAALFGGYIESFSAAALWFRELSLICGEGWDRAGRLAEEPMPRLGRTKKGADEELTARVKGVWDRAKDAEKKLRSMLEGTSEELLRDIRRSRPALEALAALVSALDGEYAARKRRSDACDFSDVEHFCIRLLCDEETGGPTALAAALSARFAEVMVDEYQDVNAVQELIFRRVSGEGERLFMVGDVKQSIYRFRLAEPEIFNRKYRAFADDENARRVLLRENFRSRGAVLEACNAVFERIMSPALGDIEYNDEARLVQGADFYPPEGETQPELCIVDMPGRGEDEETPDKRLAEARYVAGRIRDMVERGEPVYDGAGGTRPVRYGDITLLLRTPGTSGAAFRRALGEAGVPVSARQGGAFFAQPEVIFALSMLSLADNPRQDVPLIAAMRGVPFGFTPDELTAVRTAKKGELWEALCLRAEEDERCAGFVSCVRELRELSREEPTESVLRWLYDRTGLLAACAVMPDAGARYAGLMELYEYARRFESDGGRGLFRFLAWLRSLEEQGMEPSSASNANAVQMMSIHKSKGLEFPVVFLADNAHGFARSGGGQVVCHGELGIGMRMTDALRGAEWPTLAWRAINMRLRTEELSEQERVLYVAMTRARERLIMTLAADNAETKLAALPADTDGPINPQLLASASSAAPWLMRAAAADGGRTITLRVVKPGQAEEAAAEEKTEPPAARPEDVEALARRLEWRYPYAEAAALPSKLTATGVKRLLESADPEAREISGARAKRRFRKPELGRDAAPLTGAERGIAAHLVMQHIDLARTGSADEIAGEIERLRFHGFLDDRQAQAVDPGDILAFFRSDIGRRVLAAENRVREFRFSLLCPARRWFPESPAGEEILLQGVVDLCIEEGGALTIVDFKTDARIEPQEHAAQLAAYAEAMSRILQKPVRGAVLWYIRKRRAVETEIEKSIDNRS